MPTPVSATEISAIPSCIAARTSIRPPSGVNLRALESRFKRTCFTFRSSPRIMPTRSSMARPRVIPRNVRDVGLELNGNNRPVRPEDLERGLYATVLHAACHNYWGGVTEHVRARFDVRLEFQECPRRFINRHRHTVLNVVAHGARSSPLSVCTLSGDLDVRRRGSGTQADPRRCRTCLGFSM